MLRDPFGRAITYLRISLTDRCNLRCVYCMPAEGMERSPSSNFLSAKEISQVVKVAARHGVRRVRQDLNEIIARLAGIPGIEEISLTTNAMLLAKKAATLACAGLSQVNIRLDTLNPEKFRRFTRTGRLSGVSGHLRGGRYQTNTSQDKHNCCEGS